MGNFEKLLPVLQDVRVLPDVLPSVECKDVCICFLKEEWFNIYPWLKLNDDQKTYHCAVCYWAIQNKRIDPLERGNNTGNNPNNSKWIKTNPGERWASFKHGKSHLNGHEGVDHTNAWCVYQMELNKQNVDVKLRQNRSEEIRRNRVGLSVTFDSLMTCATQGIALRGHGYERKTGNLWNLVYLVSRFNEDVNKYLSRCSHAENRRAKTSSSSPSSTWRCREC